MRTAAEAGVKKLYHYQGSNPDYLRDALVNQRVFFSNPKNFNDPWDCNPYFEPAIDHAESRRKWGNLLDPLYQELSPDLRAKLEAKWNGNWYDNKAFLRKTIERMRLTVRELTVERWRMYCLTPHANSVLMWAHYAEKHRGISLEFDARSPQVSRAFQVLYADKFPVIGPDDINIQGAMPDALLLTKSQEWAYEHEYRIIARNEEIDPTFSVKTSKDYLGLEPRALTAVVAGCNADLASIQSIVDESGCGILVKRAVRRPDRYHLDVIDHAPVPR